MSELLVTQCPHCQTRFRLTPEQLSVAGGHVRCGACLEVFHAADAAAALQPAPPAPQSEPPQQSRAADIQPPAPGPRPAPPAPTQVQDSLLHDDLDDEPDLAALGLDESIISEVNPAAQLSNAEGQGATSPGLADLHEDFIATPPAQDFGPDFDHKRVGLPLPEPADQEYADKGIFQRDQPASVEKRPVTPASVMDAAAEAPDALARPTAEAVPAESAVPSPVRASRDADMTQAPDSERAEPPLAPLGLELLEEELLAADPPRRRAPSWIWTGLALLALLALPVQYLIYNFDALARDQSTRPLLENICLLAPCELPARVDISRIRSTNLLVRPHPEFPNALAIDVILYNRADFEQPFPVLDMQFADSSGRPVANRRFRPEEYLSGELAGVELMPPQTPIHVGLSMLDPGPQARSYRLEFHSP